MFRVGGYNKKIFLEIKFYFFPTFRKITVGGFVNQLIKKFWPYVLQHILMFFLVFFRRYDGCSTCGEVVRKRQQRLTCRECGLLCHRTCSGKF